jgi:hypothetical protein
MTQHDETALLFRAAIAVGCLVASMFLAAAFVLGSLT